MRATLLVLTTICACIATHARADPTFNFQPLHFPDYAPQPTLPGLEEPVHLDLKLPLEIKSNTIIPIVGHVDSDTTTGTRVSDIISGIGVIIPFAGNFKFEGSAVTTFHINRGVMTKGTAPALYYPLDGFTGYGTALRFDSAQGAKIEAGFSWKF